MAKKRSPKKTKPKDEDAQPVGSLDDILRGLLNVPPKRKRK
jgi:hypothetical protein